MIVYIPIVNAGYLAGDTPMVYQQSGQKPFLTEEECAQWIKDNEENFTLAEMCGCVCPYDIEEDDSIVN